MCGASMDYLPLCYHHYECLLPTPEVFLSVIIVSITKFVSQHDTQWYTSYLLDVLAMLLNLGYLEVLR